MQKSQLLPFTFYYFYGIIIKVCYLYKSSLIDGFQGGVKMKKISVVLIICLFALFFASCAQQEEDTAEEEGYNNELVAQIDEMKLSIDDPIFWTSSERVIRMAGEALEKDYPVSIDFRLQVGDKTKIVTDYEMYLDGSADYCRDFNISRVIFELAHDDTVISAHVSGQTVEVTGIIIRWQAKKHWFSKEMMDFSACELDSEGGWDYASTGKMEFFGMPHIISVEYEITGVELTFLSPVKDEKTLSDLRVRALR